jgi:hypothetical protein
MTATQNTIALVLTGRYRGHLPGAVLDLPEPEALVVLSSLVGRRLEDVITELEDGDFEVTVAGKAKTYKTAGGARRALEKVAVPIVAPEDLEEELEELED